MGLQAGDRIEETELEAPGSSLQPVSSNVKIPPGDCDAPSRSQRKPQRRAAPEESSSGPINYSDADQCGLVPRLLYAPLSTTVRSWQVWPCQRLPARQHAAL